MPSAFVLALTIAALWPSRAHADSPAGDDNLALQEIVVSATRVGEESLQKIPMAISVISPAALDSKGLGQHLRLRGRAALGEHAVRVARRKRHRHARIRDAARSNPTNAQQRSLVALYLDDASIGQEGFNPDLHVYDLERIEVIRGPQGTLYGAGSMAGHHSIDHQEARS